MGEGLCRDYTSEGNVLPSLIWTEFCVQTLCCQFAVKKSSGFHLLRGGVGGIPVYEAIDNISYTSTTNPTSILGSCKPQA